MLSVQDYEEFARKHLDSVAWAYYSQGVEREETLRENLRAFKRYRLLPRMLQNTTHRDFRTTVLGEKMSLPFGIAPTGFQKLAHPEGEIAVAKAASDMGIVYALSTVATTSLEDVSESVPDGSLLWMQIYILNDRSCTERTIHRAEAHGYRALVLTVDTPVTGLQLRSWRTPLILPPHLSLPNLREVIEGDKDYSHKESMTKYFCQTINWDDVTWIKSISNLPLILKGILTVDDALKAMQHGVSAIWVSNHGGRQLDGVDAAIDCLPAICSALDGSGCEVYVDGGIRWGSDILKALALGAKAVFIGRPVLWGLAHSGQQGVRHVLEILKEELDRAMNLAGCKDIRAIGPHLIKKTGLSKM